MSDVFIRPSERAHGAPTFKPWDFEDAEALVFEPILRRMGLGDHGKRPEVVTKVTVFQSWDDVEQGKPTKVIERTVTLGRIAALLADALAENRPVIGCIERSAETPHGSKGWLIDDVDEDAEEYVSAWLVGGALA